MSDVPEAKLQSYVNLINMGGDNCGMGLASDYPPGFEDDATTSRADDTEWYPKDQVDAVLAQAQHFNGLTPAETERLAMLAEECAEVIQIVGKILRHGYESHHPDTPDVSNRFLLRRELLDVHTISWAMGRAIDLVEPMPHEYQANWQRKLHFTHHQGEPK